MLGLIISGAEMIVIAAKTQQIGDLSNISGDPLERNMNLRKLTSNN
jgi:hypothetical protein